MSRARGALRLPRIARAPATDPQTHSGAAPDEVHVDDVRTDLRLSDDGRALAGGVQGEHPVHDRPAPGAHALGRAGPRRGARLPAAGEDRHREAPRRADGLRRSVPGDEGVPRRILDRRRRDAAARDRDRREGLHRARQGRRADVHPDRGAPGDERSAADGMSGGRLAPDDERALRELAPRVLGALVRRSGDFAAAEDAVQEALLAALGQWPSRGAPRNPGGWLFQAALRSLADARRSERARAQRESAVAERRAEPAPPPDDASDLAEDAHDDAL